MAVLRDHIYIRNHISFVFKLRSYLTLFKKSCGKLIYSAVFLIFRPLKKKNSFKYVNGVIFVKFYYDLLRLVH